MPQDFMAWEKAFQAISHQEHHPVAPRGSHPQAPQSPVLPRGTAQADTACLFLSLFWSLLTIRTTAPCGAKLSALT